MVVLLLLLLMVVLALPNWLGCCRRALQSGSNFNKVRSFERPLPWPAGSEDEDA